MNNTHKRIQEKKNRIIYFRIEEPNLGFDASGKNKPIKNKKGSITFRLLSYFNHSKSLEQKQKIFYTTKDPSQGNEENLSELKEIINEYTLINFEGR